jgi:hypothetical protein
MSKATLPPYKDSSAAKKIADLERLLDADLVSSKYVDGEMAAKLLAVFLTSFRQSLLDKQWESDPLLARSRNDGTALRLALAAVFDIGCNAEYFHGRMVDSNWIYCHRDGETPHAYYCFLKQCPRCCMDRGLGRRLSGAQHKPSSHHIGEITTTLSSLILQLISIPQKSPLKIATVGKQSHDVDAVGFNDETLVLFEIKASPMVSYPLVTDLVSPLVREVSGKRMPYKQHSLLDIPISEREVSLYIPHCGYRIPLGKIRGKRWPYGELIEHFHVPSNFLTFFSAWLGLFYAYKVPKTKRDSEQQSLSYLVNGWGDDIDSNKTKPGLGRTDDIKKGTYQLIKFGAYYRDDSAKTKVRGALVANLDPLFMYDGYMERLVDIRWGLGQDFSEREDRVFEIKSERLRHLYDAIIAFNEPVLNDPVMVRSFDFAAFEHALLAGELDDTLSDMASGGGQD